MEFTSTKEKRTVTEGFQDKHAEVFREMQKRRTNRSRTLFLGDDGNHYVSIFGDWWRVSIRQVLGRCWLVEKLEKSFFLTYSELDDMTDFLIEEGMCGYPEEEMLEMMWERIAKCTSDKYVDRYEIGEASLIYYCGVITSATHSALDDEARSFFHDWLREQTTVKAKPRPKKRTTKKVKPKAPEVDTDWGYLGDPKSKPYDIPVYADVDELAICEWHGVSPVRSVPYGTRVQYGEIEYDGRHDDEWYWHVTFEDNTTGIVYRENCYLDNDERKPY